MKKAKFLFGILLLNLFLTGCGEDEGPNDQFSGTIQSIEEFLTPELTETMKELGMEFHTGNTPPNIEGDYLAIPILEGTNISYDLIGSQFFDAVFSFREQNNRELSVKFSYDQSNAQGTASEKGEGIGALIAGKDDLFSVFLKVSGKLDNQPYESAMVISGKLTPTGINGFQWALFSLENYGNAAIIEKGQGRIFKDRDNLARRVQPNSRLGQSSPGDAKTFMER